MVQHFRNAKSGRTLGIVARVAAVSCLLSLVFGDVVRDLHLLVARHVVCAAHGELVEQTDGARIGEKGARSETGVIEAGSVTTDHEHCWAQSLIIVRANAAPASTPRVPIAVAFPSEILVVPRLPVFVAPCALDFAPKQGPPRAS